MKLDNLLGPYLYQYKKLNLPGIGTFEADLSTIVPEDNDKHQAPVQGITFKQSSEPEPDNELIEYIKARTGKMKPLAMADLESYLMLVRQFLNIGKPFYIEGIGTLQKITNGTLKFTPGEYISPRLESNTNDSSAGATQRTAPERKNASHTGKGTARKAIAALGVIATIAVIGWGGYYLYEMNAGNGKREEAQPAADTLIAPMPDTSAAATIIQPDSSLLINDTAAAKRTDTTARARATVIKTDTVTVKPARKSRKIQPAKNDSAPAAETPTVTDTPANAN